MMSVLVLLCGVFLGCLANHLPNHEKVFLKQVHDSCQADRNTYCDEEILKKLPANVDHKQAGIHMLCMAVKAGLQKPNGEFDKAVIKNKIACTLDDVSQADGFVEKCAVKNESPEKTAILLWLCFSQNDIPYSHKFY